MSDDSKIDAESDQSEQIKDPNSMNLTWKKCDTAENDSPTTATEFNGTDPQVDGNLEEHIRELLNILIEGDDDVRCFTSEKCVQGKEKSKEALAKMRQRKYEREMLHDRFEVYKRKFEDLLQKKKVSDHDRKNKTYAELCELVSKPKNIYEARHEFHTARMEFNESVDEYFQRLTNLASKCQFGDRQNFAIADKFILGKTTIYYTFCTEGQKEVQAKKALKICKQAFDKRIVPTYCDLDDELLCPTFSYKRLSTLSRLSKPPKEIPAHLTEMIRNEIMKKDLTVEWDDIAGLDFPKQTIKESIVWPMLRPDIFTGLRKLPKAMLLFGPPGTGKTMIAKCIAAQSKSTFFYVSAATLASKWYGESEQLVRALFNVAAEHQPSIIFFDEVDSLLTKRKLGDYEVSRRVKTEFMVQLDGAATKDDTRILFIGATNRPQDLDEAARRRFVKRLYIPLPNNAARQQLLKILLKSQNSNLTDDDVNRVASMTNDFSGADIKWLCQDAAMEPLRSIPTEQMMEIQLKDIRPLATKDFEKSLKRIRPSLANADLTALVEWDRLYGTNSDGPCSKDHHFMYS